MQESFDVIVIGAGPGGYVAAIRLAQLGFKTACIEKRKDLGGTCLNVGCIPSKTLLHASHQYEIAKHHLSPLGIEASSVSYSLPKMMQRKTDVIASLADGIRGLFKKNKITLFTGSASFVSDHEIEVSQGPTSQRLFAKYFIIASGSEPTPLPFLPFDETKVLSSTGALSLHTVPKRLVVIGAGVIGVELGSVYCRLGSDVTFIEFLGDVCASMDSDISKGLFDALQKQGMKFHLSTKVIGADISEGGCLVKIQDKEGKMAELSADAILVSIGRRPLTEGLSLERAGVKLSDKKQIVIDGSFRTSAPHIFAIGDVVDGPMLAHKASEEGVAVAEIIAERSPHVDYASIPSVVYTHPEAASVGLTSQEAEKRGLSVIASSYPMRFNSRAKCASEEIGFVKVIAVKKTGKVLGVHILAASASEMITPAAIAIKERMDVSSLADVCYAHPTLSEAMKEAALGIEGRAIHK